jgi:hypothetical protein
VHDALIAATLANSATAIIEGDGVFMAAPPDDEVGQRSARPQKIETGANLLWWP